MNRIIEIIKILVRYGDRDGGAYHAISNQVWLWNIALTLAMIPLIGVLFILYGDLIGLQRWTYLTSYTMIPVGIAAIQTSLFWWGNALHGHRLLALHLLIVSDCIMLWLFSLFVGADGGVHFLFPAALALPFYFFRFGIHGRARITKGIWIGLIIAQFAASFLLLSEGLIPLPSSVTAVVRAVIFTLAGLIIVVWAVYFWWQLGLTNKFLQFWDKVAHVGVSETLEASSQEWLRLANRVIYTIAFYWIAFFNLVILSALAIMIAKGEQFDRILKIIFVFGGAALWINLCTWGVLAVRKFYISNVKNATRQRVWLTALLVNALNATVISVLLPIQVPFSIFHVHIGYMYLYMRTESSSGWLNSITPLFLAILGVTSFMVQIKGAQPIDLPAYLYQIYGPFTIGLQVISILFFAYFSRLESNRSKVALDAERKKSDDLLLNILPAEVSQELKINGATNPREYSAATVLFTDFVGFTRIAEHMTAQGLVRELDQCFSYFDNVCAKYGLEKLKTIGDAYMAVGGIPIENKTHPVDCALAALEIQAFMNQMKEIKEQQGLPYWELRLGMHTGSLIAGVVGEKKFAYDVWGDTVNTASRMESSGGAGSINISRELYDQLRFLFECDYRGKVYAKNKGEIEMYFLRGLKPRFSINGEGRVPNEAFKEIYEKIRAGARLIEKQSSKNRETA